MNYPGGKGADGVYQAIINLMPKHRVYIEPFLGGGAILRHKKAAEYTIGIEPSRDAFQAWRHFESSEFTRNAKGDYLADVLADANDELDYIWRTGPDRVLNLEVLNDDFLAWANRLTNLIPTFQEYDNRDTLVYCDPPYLMETRSSKGKIYGDHDFSTWFDHDELLRLLLTLKCNVMISGYDHPLYNEKLAAWRKTSFAGVSRGGPRVETVWMNFPEPHELHDYRYLGNNFREREQIKRQKKRWLAKLAAMPVQRRYALMSAIEEFRDLEVSPENARLAVIAETSDAAAGSIAGDGDNRSTSPVAKNGDTGPSKKALVPASSLRKGDYIEFRGQTFQIKTTPTKANRHVFAAFPGSESGPLLSPDTLVKPIAAPTTAVNDAKNKALDFACSYVWLPDDITTALATGNPIGWLEAVANKAERSATTGTAFSYKMHRGSFLVWAEKERFGKRCVGTPDLEIKLRDLAAEVLKRRASEKVDPIVKNGDAGSAAVSPEMANSARPSAFKARGDHERYSQHHI